MFTYIIAIITSLIIYTIIGPFFNMTAILFYKKRYIARFLYIISGIINFFIISAGSYKIFNLMNEEFNKNILIVLGIIFGLNMIFQIKKGKIFYIFYFIGMIVGLIIGGNTFIK